MINLSNILSSSVSKMFSGYFKFFSFLNIGKVGATLFLFALLFIAYTAAKHPSDDKSNSNSDDSVANINYNKFRHLSREAAIEELKRAAIPDDLIKYATQYNDQERIAQEAVKIGKSYSNRIL